MYKEQTVIRRGDIDDTEDLVRLLKELFAIERDFEFNELKQRIGLEQILRDSTGEKCIMVAEQGGRIMGMCSAQTLISTAEGGPAAVIEDMVVLEGFRGKGAGKGLLRAIESWALANGIVRLQLLADKNNLAALGFYKGAGWRNTGLIGLRKMLAP